MCTCKCTWYMHKPSTYFNQKSSVRNYSLHYYSIEVHIGNIFYQTRVRNNTQELHPYITLSQSYLM